MATIVISKPIQSHMRPHDSMWANLCDCMNADSEFYAVIPVSFRTPAYDASISHHIWNIIRQEIRDRYYRFDVTKSRYLRVVVIVAIAIKLLLKTHSQSVHPLPLRASFPYSSTSLAEHICSNTFQPIWNIDCVKCALDRMREHSSG